jgi:hypothetical protein
LEHEGKCLNDEPGSPREITMKGAGWSVPALAEGGRVVIHDCISLEGLLGKYREDSDEKRGRKTAKNDRGDRGGG